LKLGAEGRLNELGEGLMSTSQTRSCVCVCFHRTPTRKFATLLVFLLWTMLIARIGVLAAFAVTATALGCGCGGNVLIRTGYVLLAACITDWLPQTQFFWPQMLARSASSTKSAATRPCFIKLVSKRLLLCLNERHKRFCYPRLGQWL
jgi:hypothetical protein